MSTKDMNAPVLIRFYTESFPFITYHIMIITISVSYRIIFL